MARMQAAPGLQDARQRLVGVRPPGASGISGLDFQAALAQAKYNTPLAFMSWHGDVPMTERAIKVGAVDFPTEPFRDPAVRKTGARSLAGLARMAEVLSPYAGNRWADSAVSAGADHDSF
jgi:DNA-binding NtrC family response regulator